MSRVLISTVRKSICPACGWKIYDLNTGYLKARLSADPGSAWDVGVVSGFGGCPLIFAVVGVSGLQTVNPYVLSGKQIAWRKSFFVLFFLTFYGIIGRFFTFLKPNGVSISAE